MDKFLQKYQELFSGKETYEFRGPLSPLLCGADWVRGETFPVFFLAKGRTSFWSIDVVRYRSHAKKKFQEYLAGKVSVEELKGVYKIQSQSILNAYESELANFAHLKALSNQELTEKIGKYGNALSDLISDTLYIETLDRSIVVDVLGSGVTDEMWEKSTHPAFLSFEARRLGVCIEALDKKRVDILDYLSFIYTDYFATKKPSEVQAQVETLKANISQKRAELQVQLEKVQKERAALENWKKSLGPQLAKVVDYLDMVMEMRDLRKDPIAQLQALLDRYANEVALRLALPSQLAYMIISAEYQKGFDYLLSIKEDLEKRVNGVCGILGTPDGFTVSSVRYEDVEKILLKTDSQDVLKGQVAFRGKVKGRVVVVLDPHDEQGFVDGDILVTGMTRPEFLPLMKRSGAVVTNEGGITCHAAIVSRELKIPCVIGTKNATQVLKTGDMVEVDANTGMVKKLS